MAHFDQVVVHILGCHMQAQRANGDDWQAIVVADCSAKGRVTHGLRVAAMNGATHMSFGTGASEKDGVKEAEHMRAQAKAIAFRTTPDGRKFSEMLREPNVRVDDVTQNTTEEIHAVFQWVTEEFSGRTLIIFVTSAFHAARATNEAAKIAHDLYGMVGGVVQYMVAPAYDSPGETFVFEESHRGDMPEIDWTPLKKLFGLFGKPKELQELVDHTGAVAERTKEGPND